MKAYIKAICGVITILFVLITIMIILIQQLPVSFDAGACAGGYSGAILSKYDDELLSLYYEQTSSPELVVLYGTQSAEWFDKTMILKFNAQCGEEIHQLTFVGTRKWIDTYEWYYNGRSEKEVGI